MSVIKRLVDIVIYLLAFATFIIWSLVIWVHQFGSPADTQTKVWAIWDASLPIASNLFAALHSIGLTLALLVLTYDFIFIFLFIVLCVVLYIAMPIYVASVLLGDRNGSPSDDHDDGPDWWGDYDHSPGGDPRLFK